MFDKLILKLNFGSLGKYFTWMYGSFVVQKFFSYGLIVLISRFLGPQGLGQYSFAFDFAAFFVIFGDLGLNYLITKYNAHIPNLLITQKILKLKMFLSGVIIVLGLSSFYLFYQNSLELVPLIYLSLTVIAVASISDGYKYFFQGHKEFRIIAMADFWERLFSLLLGGVVLYFTQDLFYFYIVLLITFTGRLFYYYYFYRISLKKVAEQELDETMKTTPALLKEGLPFWITGIFISIYFKIDNLILQFLEGSISVGYYSAGYKLVEVSSFITRIAGFVLFPVMSKYWQNKEYGQLKSVFKKALLILGSIGLLGTVFTILLAKRVILIVYGPQFVESIQLLRIMGCLFPFMFLSFILGEYLNAIGKPYLFAVAGTIGLIINIVADIIFTLKWSYVGTTYGTLLAEVVIFAILVVFVVRNYKVLKS